MAVEVGERAPEFTLRDRDEREVSLADFRGRNVVLMFFPLAFSPVCTTQFTGVADREGTEDGEDAQVVGVSVDSVYALGAWADALGLQDAVLLADFNPKGEVARAYGAWLEELGHSTRATFVIDANGVVRSAQVVKPLELPDEAAVRTALAACPPTGAG